MSMDESVGGKDLRVIHVLEEEKIGGEVDSSSRYLHPTIVFFLSFSGSIHKMHDLQSQSLG